MVKVITLLALAFFAGACSEKLHSVYIDGDRGVFSQNDKGQLTECTKTYSTWNGQTWTDYYAFPCQVQVRRHPSKIPLQTVQPKPSR